MQKSVWTGQPWSVCPPLGPWDTAPAQGERLFSLNVTFYECGGGILNSQNSFLSCFLTILILWKLGHFLFCWPNFVRPPLWHGVGMVKELFLRVSFLWGRVKPVWSHPFNINLKMVEYSHTAEVSSFGTFPGRMKLKLMLTQSNWAGSGTELGTTIIQMDFALGCSENIKITFSNTLIVIIGLLHIWNMNLKENIQISNF